MPYVMVPVPEEHVTEAMQAVLRIVARASVVDWDTHSVAELWEASDEATKSVLSSVARAVIGGAAIPDADLARAIEINVREVLGIVREVNEAAAASSHPGLLVSQMVAEQLPNGRIREQRTISMDRAVAEAVRAAEQAEREAAPHPLVPGSG